MLRVQKGPFNSWVRYTVAVLRTCGSNSVCAQDRQPFMTTIRNGTASLIPKTNTLSRNFVMSNCAWHPCLRHRRTLTRVLSQTTPTVDASTTTTARRKVVLLS